MINNGKVNRITLSVGTTGNNISTDLCKNGLDNVLEILPDASSDNRTGNVYINGLQIFEAYREEIYHQLRNILESTTYNKIDEINIINSMSGGLGSSVPMKLMELLTDEFGLQKSLFSNALLWGNNDTVLESYNQVLYMSEMYEAMDLLTCYDNSFFSQKHFPKNTSSQNINQSEMGFDGINNIISDSLMNSFIEKSEQLININKYDRSLKLYIPSVSLNERKLLDRQSQLFDLSNSSKNYTTIKYYGNIIFTPAIEKILLFDINNIEYSSKSMKTCSFIEQENTQKHYLVSNNTRILSPLENLSSNFKRFFSKGAYFQHYSDVITTDDFKDSHNKVLDIIDSYKAL